MAINRNYIIDRLRSKSVTPDEFNYDRLQAPPLNYFLSPYDISALRNIATSLKLSAKPEVRYQEIDKIMTSRGLIKFAAGTNRVVYRHPEFPDLLIKVASDAVGMGDNPAEYRNQFLLRPFVCKCFEISPCGTVGLFEKVNPIHSREEYLSVADDVFELINTWLIGEYVLADIGSNFFANMGIRSGFGVVLLDYPYVYKLDGNKLFCNKMDPSSPSGCCDGVIDYDDGYNFLVCKKCGAIYKAKELEEKIKSNIIRNDNGGKINMKITISGGSNSVAKTTVETASNDCSLFKVTKERTSVPTKKEKYIPKVVAPVAKKEDEVKKEEPVAPVAVEEVKEETKVIPAEELLAEETEVTVEPVHNDESTVKAAFTIDESIINDRSEAKTVKSPVRYIEDDIDSIISWFNEVELEASKEDVVDRLVELALNIAKTTNYNNGKLFNKLIGTVKDIYNNLEDKQFIDATHNEDLIELVKSYEIGTEVTGVSVVDGQIQVDYVNKILTFEDELANEEEYVVAETRGKKVLVDIPEELVNNAMENTTVNEAGEESPEEKSTSYCGVDFYDGYTIDIRDIIPNQNNANIIVIKDSDGNYVTNNNNMIIAIGDVNDVSLNASKFVSKHWFEQAEELLKREEEQEEDEIENSSTEEVTEEIKSMPVGVMAPTEEE